MAIKRQEVAPFVNGAEGVKGGFRPNADQLKAIRAADVQFFTVQHDKKYGPFSIKVRTN